jgi:hypothetical protein
MEAGLSAPLANTPTTRGTGSPVSKLQGGISDSAAITAVIDRRYKLHFPGAAAGGATCQK